MKADYCIYEHISPSGKVYVGQTNNVKRRWGYNGEHYKNKKKNGDFIQPVFARAIIKYGWNNFTHIIVLDNQTKSEADYAEKYLISWYKSCNMSYNITEGGEGTIGHRTVYTPEIKEAIRQRLLSNPPMKGKKHTPEALAKITEANRNRIYTPEQKERMRQSGKRLSQIPVTEERRIKYSEYRKAHPETWIGGWNKKEVYQYDLNGNYITSYPSAISAADSVGRNISGGIGKCIE